MGGAIRSREDHSDEKITHHEVGWSPLRNHPINVRGGQVSDWEESQMLAALAFVSYPRLCSDGAPQTAHDIGKTGLQGLPTRVTVFLWALSRQGDGPPIHNMGFCSRLGESPNTWKHFGPELTQEQYSVLL